MSLDKVRIVFLGDSGCGKSSFVSLIANNEVLTNSWTTVGCQIEVKLHEYKEDTSHQKQFFIELFDVGASMSHKISRNIFYQQANGVVLVHDLTNRKSQANLKNWLMEIINKDGKDVLKGTSASVDDLDPEQFLGICQLPILVVGTKNDLIDDKQRKIANQGLAQEIGADEIYVNSRDVRCIQAGSTNAVKLFKFFDKVIERKYFARGDSSTFYDRQRKIVGATSIQSPLLSDSNRYFSPFTSPTIGNYSNFSANLAQPSVQTTISE